MQSTTIPKCKCGKDCHLNKAYPHLGYTKYCSDVCSKKYRTLNKNYNIILSDSSWLYNQRIILNKSKDLIASELGCSVTVINKWIKTHNIPNIRLNESNTDVLLKLRDYNWLYNKYKIEGLTCEQISNEIGSSKSTISVWLNKHGIEITPSNTYDRNNYVSSEEQEVVDYIKSIYDGEIITSNRKILSTHGLEIDIFLPEKNIAIEYNGVYSHLYRPNEKSFSAIKNKKYHLLKTTECLKQNIKLIHIFSSSWQEKKSIWKNYIKNQLGITKYKIFARNCYISELDVQSKNKFLQENHLQGKDKSTLKYGLFLKNNDLLVAVMTFVKPRFTKKYDWELSRFSVLGDYSVVGGFSKLLSHMRNHHKGTIISYADRTYSKGDVYFKNGFKLIRTNPPSYYYVLKNTNTMIHRMNMTKKNLLKRLNRPELTEEELSCELGYSKIFDCGTLSFVIT